MSQTLSSLKFQILSRVALLARCHLLGSSSYDNPASITTSLGTKVYNPVGTLDDLHIVLDNDNAMTPGYQSIEGLKQTTYIVEVETRSGLIKDEHQALLTTLLHKERGELHTLRLTTRQCRRRLSQLDISQAHLLQGTYALDDTATGGVIPILAKEGYSLTYRHLQDVVYRLIAILNLQNLGLEALASTSLALQLNIGHKLHTHLDDTLTLALLTSATRHIEGEGRGLDTRMLGIGLVGKELAYLVVGLDIGHGYPHLYHRGHQA